MNSFHPATVVVPTALVISLDSISPLRIYFGAGDFRGISEKSISPRRFFVGALMPAFAATGKLFHGMMTRDCSYKLK